MIGELILLPVRVGVQATRLWLRVAEETVNLAANATGRVTQLAASRGSGGSRGAVTPRSDRTGGQEDASRGEASRRLGASDVEADAVAALEHEPPAPTGVKPPEPRETVLAHQPTHVSEGPTLVEEFSEPGARDGAGAEVHVQEPWEGYRQMNAKQVIDRVGTATQAVLAAVKLYESTHRRRQTIVNAVDRQLRSPNGSRRK